MNSALDHLATSLFGTNCSERLIFVGNCFTCHWDESGSDPGTEGRCKSDGPIVLVGGYLAHVKDWVLFEKQWRAILDTYKLPYFHMTAFANNRRPYANWKEEDRAALIGSLLDVIADFPRMRFSCSMEVDDYRLVVKVDNIGDEDIVRAYHICARKCIEHVSDLARLVKHTHKILHIFDRGNSAWPTFEAKFTQAMLDSLNILQPISQSKVDVVALQSADIIAQQSARNILIESRRATETKRIYTKRLFNKPGLLIHATRKMVKDWYKEEQFIESHRRRGMYPRRSSAAWMNTIPQMYTLIDMFAEPENHHITSLLRESQ